MNPDFLFMEVHQSFLDFGTWQCVGTDEIPSAPGVYIILGREPRPYWLFYEVIYVGSTRNLKKRLSNHEVIRRFKTTRLRVHFLEIINYRYYEIAMIEKYAPLANIQHQVNG